MHEILNKEEKRITKLQITVSLILVIFLSITGATYAYFAYSATNNNTITGDAASVNLTLNVSRIYPTEESVNTGVLVPQLSTSGSATSPLNNALKNGCIDANNNIVCHLYKIVIQNSGGTATQVVTGKISFFGNPELTTNISTVMPNLKWRLVSSVNETTPANCNLGANTDHVASSAGEDFVSELSMVTNSLFTYYIIIWIGETNSDQPVDVGSTFHGVIEFNSSNGTGVTSTFA